MCIKDHKVAWSVNCFVREVITKVSFPCHLYLYLRYKSSFICIPNKAREGGSSSWVHSCCKRRKQNEVIPLLFANNSLIHKEKTEYFWPLYQLRRRGWEILNRCHFYNDNEEIVDNILLQFSNLSNKKLKIPPSMCKGNHIMESYSCSI